MRKIISVISVMVGLCLTMTTVRAGDHLPYAIIGHPTGTTPYFFGPNTYPVPAMLKNTVGRMEISAGGEFAVGHLAPSEDYTATSLLGIRIPLWSDRVNLSVYGQVHEWFWDNEAVRALRKVSPELPLRGDNAGDAYFTLDMRLLNETSRIPLVTLRIALKTASGDKYEYGRYYDAPGYHFDLCATKSKSFPEGAFLRKVSVSANLGFLCWQTDIGCQNDAVLYGIGLEADSKAANLELSLGGYSGMEKFHDKPLTFKAGLILLPDSRLAPLVRYEKGIRDWPFDVAGLGLRYRF